MSDDTTPYTWEELKEIIRVPLPFTPEYAESLRRLKAFVSRYHTKAGLLALVLARAMARKEVGSSHQLWLAPCTRLWTCRECRTFLDVAEDPSGCIERTDYAELVEMYRVAYHAEGW